MLASLASAAQSSNDVLKVMSLAVRSASQDDGTNVYFNNRWPAIKACLKEYNPSILLVQQAEWGQMLSGFDNELYLDYEKVWYPCIADQEKSQYVIIYYRKSEFTEVKKGHFWFSETPEKISVGWNGCSMPRDASWTILRHNGSGKEFMVCNIILENARKCIAHSLPLLQNRLYDITEYKIPVIVGGLFWVDPKDGLLDNMKRDYKDAYSSSTTADKLPTYNDFGSAVENRHTPDHIFYRGFKSNRYKVITKKYENIKYMSDHYPIYVELEFRNN